jgi:protocatechuate 3,4-dioxygenase beta subunit
VIAARQPSSCSASAGWLATVGVSGARYPARAGSCAAASTRSQPTTTSPTTSIRQPKQWLIEVGEAGEWPLPHDALVEHVVEWQAQKDRVGSQGTILGPFYLPDAPVLQALYELPHRPDEKGERLLITSGVLSADGTPLPGAVLDVWQADADGLYSGFSEIPAGLLRGKVITDAAGHFEVRTIAPAPYTIPHEVRSAG